MTKVALDGRIVNPDAEDYEGSKINRCIEEILRIDEEHPQTAQVVFCDTNTPQGDASDIRQRLYERQEVNGYSFEELRTDEFMNAVAEVYDEEAHAQGGISVVLRSKIADAPSAKREMLQRDCLQSLRQLLAGYRQSH